MSRLKMYGNQPIKKSKNDNGKSVTKKYFES